MKGVTTYLLLIAFTASLLGNLLLLADYALHTDYYANVLCENNDEPERKCNGKCQLGKTTETEDFSDFTFPKLTDFSFDSIEAKITESLQNPFFFYENRTNFYHLTIPVSDFVFGVFHPPQFEIVA